MCVGQVDFVSVGESGHRITSCAFVRSASDAAGIAFELGAGVLVCIGSHGLRRYVLIGDSSWNVMLEN